MFLRRQPRHWPAARKQFPFNPFIFYIRISLCLHYLSVQRHILVPLGGFARRLHSYHPRPPCNLCDHPCLGPFTSTQLLSFLWALVGEAAETPRTMEAAARALACHHH